jgi:hypothetical protein
MQGGSAPGTSTAVGAPGGTVPGGAPPPWAWLLEGADSDELEGPGSGPGSDILVSHFFLHFFFFFSLLLRSWRVLL